MAFHFPEEFRITTGIMASDKGQAGAFRIHWLAEKKKRVSVTVIASTEYDWDHVSVSHHMIIPHWSWMCRIKDLFWDEEDTVMQLHPPKSEYVNNHSRCLHLWRPTKESIPMPPFWLVGIAQEN